MVKNIEKNELLKKYPNIKIKWSIGTGNWARIPWIAFLDSRETTTTQKGLYCVFLFREDMTGVYLTLQQGVTKPIKKLGGKEGRQVLKDNAIKIRKNVEELSEYGFNLNDDINLRTKSRRGRDYEISTIGYKFYGKDEIPQDQEIFQDIDSILQTYTEFLSDKKKKSDSHNRKEKLEMTSFLNYLKEKGFIYDTKLVENFLLSLKVKPFVILTGNSGTGKTKIAQLFADYIGNGNIENNKIIESKVSVGKSYNSGGWSFSREKFFGSFPELQSIEGTYPIEVNGMTGTGRLVLTPRLFYSNKDNEIKKMLKDMSEKDKNKKIKLKIEAGSIESINNENYRIIPVGANWTENRHVIGFYNVITKKYESTESLDLLLHASNHKSTPHFLILDEMNLSHVERYFSHFLSGIESNESIPLHNQKEIIETDKIPTKLKIPSNLLIIGTVNIDETTYMFSPKVLDRANTIEFETYPAKQYMNGTDSKIRVAGNLDYLENPLSDPNIENWSINRLRDGLNSIKTKQGDLLWDVLAEEINNFQKTLSESDFDFGFRVINEIIRFMYVSWKYEMQPNPWPNWERYFDAQIKQKILPKIHGSQRSLGDLFKKLMILCIKEKTDREPRNMQNLDYISKYETSAKKIRQMDKILHEQRYVSFTR